MNVNIKICEILNDFNIVSNHRHTKACWNIGVGSFNAGLQPVNLKASLYPIINTGQE